MCVLEIAVFCIASPFPVPDHGEERNKESYPAMD
jgi:hypothetical protein